MKKIVLCGFLCMLFFVVACTDNNATDAEYASLPFSISDAVLTSSSSWILSSSDFHWLKVHRQRHNRLAYPM